MEAAEDSESSDEDSSSELSSSSPEDEEEEPEEEEPDDPEDELPDDPDPAEDDPEVEARLGGIIGKKVAELERLEVGFNFQRITNLLDSSSSNLSLPLTQTESSMDRIEKFGAFQGESRRAAAK